MKNIKKLIMLAGLIVSAQSLVAKTAWQSVFGKSKNKQQIVIYNNMPGSYNIEFNWTPYRLVQEKNKASIQPGSSMVKKAPVSTAHSTSITIGSSDSYYPEKIMTCTIKGNIFIIIGADKDTSKTLQGKPTIKQYESEQKFNDAVNAIKSYKELSYKKLFEDEYNATSNQQYQDELMQDEENLDLSDLSNDVIIQNQLPRTFDITKGNHNFTTQQLDSLFAYGKPSKSNVKTMLNTVKTNGGISNLKK